MSESKQLLTSIFGAVALVAGLFAGMTSVSAQDEAVGEADRPEIAAELQVAPGPADFAESAQMGAEAGTVSPYLGRVQARQRGTEGSASIGQLRQAIMGAGQAVQACQAQACEGSDDCFGGAVFVGRCGGGQGCRVQVAHDNTGNAEMAQCAAQAVASHLTANNPGPGDGAGVQFRAAVLFAAGHDGYGSCPGATVPCSGTCCGAGERCGDGQCHPRDSGSRSRIR
jgi:hypothetical protein